ncbi:MAG: CDP-diacylglycerol--serine O-phosphatidyltransferase [Rhodospirillaceae bacterium]
MADPGPGSEHPSGAGLESGAPQRRRRLRRRVPRLQGLSINRIIPNMLTLFALAAGLTAIRFGLAEQFERAVVAIAIAAVFDGLDGRVARILKATSKFGAELDSLSDFVCFGVAPAILLYLWTLSGAGGMGWALVLLFVVCAALRLARFNTVMGGETLPPWAYNYFQGVPAPAGAGLVLLPMILSFEVAPDFFADPWVAGAVMVLVAGLMVSQIPTLSFKTLRIPQSFVLPLMLGMGLLAAFLVTNPWATLATIGLLYLCSIPFGMRSYRRLAEEAEAVLEAEEREQKKEKAVPTAATEPPSSDP